MGRATPVFNEKKHPRSSPRTFLSWHTFLTRTRKSRQNATLFSDGTIFFHPPEIQVSKYTPMLSEFRFSKKGKIIKSKFRMVNLCNGGTKDFVELLEIIYLKI